MSGPPENDSGAAPNHENARPTKSIEESSGETVDESASVSPAVRSGDAASVTDDPGERKPRIASGAVLLTRVALACAAEYKGVLSDRKLEIAELLHLGMALGFSEKCKADFALKVPPGGWFAQVSP